DLGELLVGVPEGERGDGLANLLRALEDFGEPLAMLEELAERVENRVDTRLGDAVEGRALAARPRRGDLVRRLSFERDQVLVDRPEALFPRDEELIDALPPHAQPTYSRRRGRMPSHPMRTMRSARAGSIISAMRRPTSASSVMSSKARLLMLTRR